MAYPSARSLVMIRSLSTRALGQPSETSPTRGGLGSVVTFIGRAAPLTGFCGEIEALCRLPESQQLLRRVAAAEFEQERGDMSRVNVFGGNCPALAVGQVETVARVGDENHVPPHVGAGADGGRDTLVGRDAERDHVPGAEALQAQVEIRADEGRVDALGD